MNKRKISRKDKIAIGTHSFFMYYGEEHLLLNLFYYITDGIRKGELIYSFLQKDLYDKLLALLSTYRINAMQHIIRYHTENMNLLHKIKSLDKFLLNFGYKGLRGIVDTSYFIQKTQKMAFLNYERECTRILSNRFSQLCLYNYGDYIGEQEYIDDEVMEAALIDHAHRLYQFVLEPLRAGLPKYNLLVVKNRSNNN